MELMNLITIHFLENMATIQNSLNINPARFAKASSFILSVLMNDNKILVYGSGASAAISQLFAAKMID